MRLQIDVRITGPVFDPDTRAEVFEVSTWKDDNARAVRQYPSEVAARDAAASIVTRMIAARTVSEGLQRAYNAIDQEAQLVRQYNERRAELDAALPKVDR